MPVIDDMSSPSRNAGLDDSFGPPSDTISAGIACNGCRKAKLRCSRDRPACQHCRRTGLDCVYQPGRIKPGVKTGAIENLHKRLDALEQFVLRRGPQQQDQNGQLEPDTSSVVNAQLQEATASSILALLARELPRLVDSSKSQQLPISEGLSIKEARKRRRMIDSSLDPIPAQHDPPSVSAEFLETIVSTYFSHIHPWIPMINQARFRSRLEANEDRSHIQVVLYSMAISMLKFVPPGDVPSSFTPVDRIRKWVLSTAMDCLSLDSLQALIIIAFNDIGNGEGEKCWSIIGSLTRTVQYNQLTIEHDAIDRQPLYRPFTYLKPTQDWAELEERRRVFWNIFNLDRFCSVTMGWNTSLTSDDVYRRLPCDGVLWRKEEAVETPFLGIWDKSAGRIGKPIAVTPTTYKAPDQPVLDTDSQSQLQTSYPAAGAITTDMSRVGAFAYCVEATESMSRVTSYFLQQHVDFADQGDINSWLTRFKELDLRLVHWKMLLPQKWANNNPRQGRMDPNLTLAHVTHNTSLIMLHQLIAYAPSSWTFRKRLPSVCSAETCCSAAVEISTITENYLRSTPETLPLTNQYAFCVYMAARVLLVHWQYDAEDKRLLNEFGTLTESLKEMSGRWAGQWRDDATQRHDLAGKYATKLKDLHKRCSQEDNFSVNVLDYPCEVDHRNAPDAVEAFDPPQPQPSSTSQEQLSNAIEERRWTTEANNQSRLTLGDRGTPSVPMDTTSGTQSDYSGPPMNNEIMLRLGGTPQASIGVGDINGSPPMLLDPQFMGMDRVMAFDDGSMFAAGLEGGGW